MSTQQNTTLVKKLFEEFYSKNNVANASQYFTEDVKLTDPAMPSVRGLPQYKEVETTYLTAFPNRSGKINELVATEDKVVVYWTFQGTHKGDLQGISPTGKTIKVTGISIYQFTNGKISHVTQNWDRLGMLEQLGAIEPLEALHQ